MDVLSILSNLKDKAAADPAFRAELTGAADTENPRKAFCRTARANGFDLYEMDLIEAGNDFYAAMKRSQNGGGENSPVLENPSDYFESFLQELGNIL